MYLFQPHALDSRLASDGMRNVPLRFVQEAVIIHAIDEIDHLHRRAETGRPARIALLIEILRALVRADIVQEWAIERDLHGRVLQAEHHLRAQSLPVVVHHGQRVGEVGVPCFDFRFEAGHGVVVQAECAGRVGGALVGCGTGFDDFSLL